MFRLKDLLNLKEDKKKKNTSDLVKNHIKIFNNFMNSFSKIDQRCLSLPPTSNNCKITERKSYNMQI